MLLEVLWQPKDPKDVKISVEFNIKFQEVAAHSVLHLGIEKYFKFSAMCVIKTNF